MTVNILARVERAMASDTERQDKQSGLIEDAYQQASTEGRALVDEVFVALCGWSLKTILAGEDDNHGDDEPWDADEDDGTWQLDEAGHAVKRDK